MENAKERRVLQGKSYSALIEIGGGEAAEHVTAFLHSYLSSAVATYVCKQCHTVLSKYGSIMDEMSLIRRHVKGAITVEPTSESLSATVRLQLCVIPQLDPC